MTHKAGFVNIIGNPNVGKSTLMNALVGERLSIITSKAQTTRHRILGIVNGDDFSNRIFRHSRNYKTCVRFARVDDEFCKNLLLTMPMC